MGRTDYPEDLTFGLEFKYLFSVPLTDEVLGAPLPISPDEPLANVSPTDLLTPEQKEQLQRRAYALVISAIERVPGQRAVASHEIVKSPPKEHLRNVSSPLEEREFWRSHWIVKKANSVKPREETALPGEFLVGVEVLAPQSAWISNGSINVDLDDGNGSNTSEYDGTDDSGIQLDSGHNRHLEDIGDVLRSLIDTGRLRANYTCDFHVHTGRRDGEPFSLLTLKRLATLLWLAEPIIRLVRNPQSPNFNHSFTWGSALREASRLARGIPPVTTDPEVEQFRDTTFPQYREQHECPIKLASKEVRTIWQATSVWEIGMLLSGPERKHRRMGFNLSGLAGEDERARSSPRTIEFRFLEGRVREDLMVGWVHICCKLIELSMLGDTQYDEVIAFLASLEAAAVASETQNGHLKSKPQGTDPLPPVEWNNRLGRPDHVFSELMELVGVDTLWYMPWVGQIRQDRRLEVDELLSVSGIVERPRFGIEPVEQSV